MSSSPHGPILVFLIKRRLLYLTGKTSTWANRPKSPPPSFLPFGEIPSSYHMMWCNFAAEPYIMHHWTLHWWLGRKAPAPKVAKQAKFFRLNLSISCNFQQLWVQLAERPPRGGQTGKIFLDWIYPFHAISSNFGFSWQKSPPPTDGKRPSSCHTWRIPMVPILQIHTQIPPIRISYRIPTLSTFQNTHIYRTTGHKIMVQVEGL